MSFRETTKKSYNVEATIEVELSHHGHLVGDSEHL